MPEGTLSEPTAPPETTEETTTPEGTVPEGTLEDQPDEPDVVLRVEGAPKTTFSGVCTVGDERSVLSGRVPKRFTFDLDGHPLSCRIQKRDNGDGSLRVILRAGGSTRSVQESNVPGGTIRLSYNGDNGG
jgi:hypothetical protein